MVEVKFSKAMKRLEEIISKIENDETDIDELSERVKEAVGLIKTCKERIQKAEMEVKQVVDGLAEKSSNN